MQRVLAVGLLAVLPACGGSDAPPLPSFTDAYGFGTKVQLEPIRNK